MLTQGQLLDRLVGAALVPQAARDALLEDGVLRVDSVVHCKRVCVRVCDKWRVCCGRARGKGSQYAG